MHLSKGNLEYNIRLTWQVADKSLAGFFRNVGTKTKEIMAGGPAVDGPGSKHPVKIIANIFISFIGAGVLGLPYAFKEVCS